MTQTRQSSSPDFNNTLVGWLRATSQQLIKTHNAFLRNCYAIQVIHRKEFASRYDQHD